MHACTSENTNNMFTMAIRSHAYEVMFAISLYIRNKSTSNIKAEAIWDEQIDACVMYVMERASSV